MTVALVFSVLVITCVFGAVVVYTRPRLWQLQALEKSCLLLQYGVCSLLQLADVLLLLVVSGLDVVLDEVEVL